MTAFRQASYDEPPIFSMGSPGRTGTSEVWGGGEGGTDGMPKVALPREVAREGVRLPEVSQVEVVRHYTRLSQMTWGIDTGPYPLGSCTMKYNPKVNEDLASMDAVQQIHPLQGLDSIQGALSLMYRLERALSALTGMSKFTLQPAAGANGELTGCLMMRKHFEIIGKPRPEMIVPDSAHGTNPASAAMAGFRVVEVPTGKDGCVDVETLKGAVSGATAGFMMTNPNTLGIFEGRAMEIAGIVHDAGGLMYYDGANFQGILGRARPGDLGFDIAHLNLHKTFSTPHGGGGPGAGPVGAAKGLEGLLPVPTVEREGGEGGEGGERYRLEWCRLESIGKVRAWYGSFPVLVRAYAYLLSMGAEGLRTSSGLAVLNTNYFASRIAGIRGFDVPYGGLRRKHEVVVSAERLAAETGIGAGDVAKALIDMGLHPPTVYFPLIVKEALMFEFADSETKEAVDAYVAALKRVSGEAYSDPSRISAAPMNAAIGRLDEVRASHPKTMRLSHRHPQR